MINAKNLKGRLALWIAVLAMGGLLLNSCKPDEPEKPEEPKVDEVYEGAPYVIYDTDIGSSTDDLFALGAIYNFAHYHKECNLIGGIVCRMGEEYIRLADIMNTYYGFGDIPIGVERHGVENPHAYIPYGGIADLKNADGTPMFARSIEDYSALPEGWKLYRKLLADKPDNSVDIIAIGFMSSVAQLLESEPDEYSDLNGVELVEQKVRGLFVMGGKFGEDQTKPGYNFGHKTAINFSIKLFELWPHSVPIYFSPSLTGDYLDYPVDSVLKDLAWIEANPIKQVYKNYDCNTGQRMWDFYSAIMSLRNPVYYIGNQAPGIVTINEKEEGTGEYEMIFTPDPKGYCYYQTLQTMPTPHAEDIKWLKRGSTNETYVRPMIHPTD